MNAAIEGVIPPILTPRSRTGEVDAPSVVRLVDHLVRAGVGGLFVCGSTGEVALLSQAMRAQLVATVMEAVAGRVPVYVGAIATGTGLVIEEAAEAQRAGAAGVVVTSPFYVMPNDNEIQRHFEMVREAVDIPVIAYDIGSATHVPLPLGSLETLARNGTIVAVKDSSGDITKFRDLLTRVADTGVRVLTGSETFSDVAVELGASGIVPGLGNVDPAGYVDIYNAVRMGDIPRARRQQARMRRLFDITQAADSRRIGFTAGALGGFKAALYLEGVLDCPRTWDPLSPLEPDEFSAIADLMCSCDVPVVKERVRAIAAGHCAA